MVMNSFRWFFRGSLALVSCTALAISLHGEEALPAEVVARIDGLFARWDKPDMPGANVAISRNGEMIYSRGFGMADIEHVVPMTPEAQSETGSVAKQFTAAALVTLAVRGKLSLDD